MVEKKIHVLVVDDDREFNAVFARLLQQDSRLKVTTNATAWVAQDIERQPPDIMFIDWNIGAFDGVKLIKTLKVNRYTSHIKIVLMSGNDLEQLNQQLEPSGAHAVLSKLGSPESLFERANQLIAKFVVPGEVL